MFRKGQKVWILSLATSGPTQYTIQSGKVVEDKGNSVFVRLDDKDAGTAVVDRDPSEVYNGERAALSAALIRARSAAAKWTKNADELADRLATLKK